MLQNSLVETLFIGFIAEHWPIVFIGAKCRTLTKPHQLWQTKFIASFHFTTAHY